MNKLLILLLIVPFIGFGQCKKKEKDERSEGTYYGCLNDEGNYHGDGTFTFKSREEYEGVWEDGEIINGSILFENPTQIQEYKGGIKNWNPSGKGSQIYYFKDNNKNREKIRTLKGEFRSGILFNGIMISEYNGGAITTNTIENAEVIDTKDNRKNYYNPNDIDGENKETIITLERKGDHHYIDFEINSVSCQGIFDTGAFGLKIGNRLYKRLISNGVEVHDLNMEAKILGIGGVSNGGYFKFEEIKIGEYTVKDVIAVVSLDQDYTLIGTQFFEKFSNVHWHMKERTLKLYR